MTTSGGTPAGWWTSVCCSPRSSETSPVDVMVAAPAVPARPDAIHALGVSSAEVYPALDSSPRGLAQSEAADRLSQAGPNSLPAARRTPLVVRFAAQFTDLFAVVLL